MSKLVYANAVRYDAPESLEELAGPSSGIIELPRGLYWGPEVLTDLGNPVDVQRMYQAVVRIGTVAEQQTWLDAELLVKVWPTLVLPVRCRALWVSSISELAGL